MRSALAWTVIILILGVTAAHASQAPAESGSPRLWIRQNRPTPGSISASADGDHVAAVYTVNRDAWLHSLKALPPNGKGVVEVPIAEKSFDFDVERLPIDFPYGQVGLPDFRRFRGVPRDRTRQIEARIALRDDTFAIVLIDDDYGITVFADRGEQVELITASVLDDVTSGRASNCATVDSVVRRAGAMSGAISALPVPPRSLPPRALKLALMPDVDFWRNRAGRTVRGALWQMLKATNAASGVFRRELNLELTPVLSLRLVPRDDVVWKSAVNYDSVTRFAEEHFARVLTPRHYDLGHVMTFRDEGQAPFRTACALPRGVGETGFGNPHERVSIRILVHELSHQMNAHHSYNGDCVGRDPEGAWEPGSGNTIMGFRFECGKTPSGMRRLPILHEQNVAEMVQYLDRVCGVPPPRIGNRSPTARAASVVPVLRDSSFALYATSSDPDRDPLRARWSEVRASETQTKTSPPAYFSAVVRSQDGLDLPSPREFWQEGPITGTMKFRFTVRDGAGGIASVDTTATISSVSRLLIDVPAQPTSDAPFVVRWRPDGPVDEVYQQAKWMRVRLSIDGGTQFPHVLADTVANTGVVTVCTPLETTEGKAMIRLEARDGGFFATSPAFSIAHRAEGATASGGGPQNGCSGHSSGTR